MPLGIVKGLGVHGGKYSPVCKIKGEGIQGPNSKINDMFNSLYFLYILTFNLICTVIIPFCFDEEVPGPETPERRTDCKSIS
jgi:hypothetical protein